MACTRNHPSQIWRFATTLLLVWTAPMVRAGRMNYARVLAEAAGRQVIGASNAESDSSAGEIGEAAQEAATALADAAVVDEIKEVLVRNAAADAAAMEAVLAETEAEVALQREEIGWKWCTGRGKTTKKYHMELTQNNTDGTVERTAIEFVRTAKVSSDSPYLKIGHSYTWTVREAAKNQLIWNMQAVDPIPPQIAEHLQDVSSAPQNPAAGSLIARHVTQEPGIKTIDLINDVDYLHCNKELTEEQKALAAYVGRRNPCVLTIYMRDGTHVPIEGGLYLVETLVARAVRKLTDKAATEATNFGKEKQRSTIHGALAGSSIKRNIAVGATSGLAFSATGALLGAVAPSLLMGGALGAVGLGGAAAGVGAFGGLLVGILAAFPLAILTSIAATSAHIIHTHSKYFRELRLSAGEKIYEKLRCHNSFQECKKGNVLRPKERPCPTFAQ